jgi:hypothetical protein
MKRFITLLILSSFLFYIFSCTGEEEPVISLNNISPSQGPFDTQVDLLGQNFGTIKSDIEVEINQKKVEIISVTNEKLTVRIPVGVGTGNVIIRIKGKIIQGPEFKYILTPVVSSLVGSPTSSYKDGPLVTAGFGTPYGMTFDSDNNLYVCDRTNHSIRKITSDVISTIAGNPQLTSGYQDGNGSNARFTWPVGIKFNSEGNLIISDVYGIRTMNKSADVTAIAGSLTLGFKDGVGAEASFTSAEGIAINQNDDIFIVDNENSSIRKVTKEGVVTTLAGDGTRGLKNGAGLSAQFNEPYGIAIDKSGNLYVADTFNNLIRKVTPDGTVTTFAGGEEGYQDGSLTTARFYYPRGIAFDAEGNLLVVERGNNRVRKISTLGEVTTLAGNGSPGITDGKAMSAKFNQPTDIAINSKGEIYISELGNRMIRKIEFK